MSGKLPTDIAIDQYHLIQKLIKSKGGKAEFDCDVTYEISEKDIISLRDVLVQFSDYSDHYRIHIYWEDSGDQLGYRQKHKLGKIFSKTASTYYQKVRQSDEDILIIENDNLTITITIN